jgi:Polyketide cyclase / dehydrase and lipid transport
VIEHDFRTTVARSPEEIFDFLADLRNAPKWEPNCQAVEKTSDGPIGKGTTFRAKKRIAARQSGARHRRAFSEAAVWVLTKQV